MQFNQDGGFPQHTRVGGNSIGNQKVLRISQAMFHICIRYITVLNLVGLYYHCLLGFIIVGNYCYDFGKVFYKKRW